MSTPISIGIIGGSGLYDMAELTDREERVMSTPFGDPSGPYILATLRGRRVAFLARHGQGPVEIDAAGDVAEEGLAGQLEEDALVGRFGHDGAPAGILYRFGPGVQ